MSKPLSRKEAETLAALFGCRIESEPTHRSSGEVWQATYVVHQGKREYVGANAKFFPWTANDWTKAFQRVSGISSANLWEQGRRAW